MKASSQVGSPAAPRWGLGSAGAFLLLAGTVNILLNMVSEGAYPNYNVGANALSDMGAIGSPTYLLWNGQLFVTGLLLLFGMLLFLRSPSNSIPNRRFAWFLYVISPVGAIMVSLFPENSIPILHVIGAFMVFIFGGLGYIYAYTFTRAPFRYLSILLGVVSLMAITLFWAPLVVGFGVAERLVVYSGNIWTVAFGGYLMAKG